MYYSRKNFLKLFSSTALGTLGVGSVGLSHVFGEQSSIVYQKQGLNPVPFQNMDIDGPLRLRAKKNYDRLEKVYYQPENVFNPTINSKGWPGDKEGRIILGLALEAQTTHREPEYLTGIINNIPEYVNEKSYLGPMYKDKANEQQLSGHGWFLRGLCEYYMWKEDPEIKKYVHKIVQNLALPTKEFYEKYPLDPDTRKKGVGEEAGTTQNTVNDWILSSDVGCAFIFLDGVVQAYQLFPSKETKELIEVIIDRYFDMDPVGLNAQAHATLTGLRGVLRYYSVTQRNELLDKSVRRYKKYKNLAMTENYENFNWFGRPEWTEGGAVIDSYMVAVQLWQFTQKAEFLEDAQHIYFNGFTHVQRENGGFGTDNCPGPAGKFLKVSSDEAYWCCTMRGGEGIARAIQYNYFTNNNEIIIPFYNSSQAKLKLGDNGHVTIKQLTEYPFNSEVRLKVLDTNTNKNSTLKLFAPSWIKNHKLSIDGKDHHFSIEDKFVVFGNRLKEGTTIKLSFDMEMNMQKPINRKYTKADLKTIRFGPLILGHQSDQEIEFDSKPEFIRKHEGVWIVRGRDDLELTPVYHLLNNQVWKETGYQKQILF